MAVIFRPATVAEYYETVRRQKEIVDHYDSLTDVGEAEKWHEEHWDWMKAYIEPPPVNALILQEFMDKQEAVLSTMARAFKAGAEVLIPRTHLPTAPVSRMDLQRCLETIADELTRAPNAES